MPKPACKMDFPTQIPPHVRVGVVLVWYFDGTDEDEVVDMKVLARLLPLTYDAARGDFAKMNADDVWCFYDALGSYPFRDEVLEAIYLKACEEQDRQIPPDHRRY